MWQKWYCDKIVAEGLEGRICEMILLLLFLQLLPNKEIFIYETKDKDKIGRMDVISQKDSLGYHVVYTSDRTIEVILDTLNLGTLYINKIVDDELELKISRAKKFNVWFKGHERTYREDKPIYDRHTLDFALRGFEYTPDFKTVIRLHVPELMIINADIEVVGEEVVSTPLGEIPCWKVEMKPRVFFIRKKIFFWFEKDYPHRFIKLEDESGKKGIRLIGTEG